MFIYNKTSKLMMVQFIYFVHISFARMRACSPHLILKHTSRNQILIYSLYYFFYQMYAPMELQWYVGSTKKKHGELCYS